jgi:hypothetical protein
MLKGDTGFHRRHLRLGDGMCRHGRRRGGISVAPAAADRQQSAPLRLGHRALCKACSRDLFCLLGLNQLNSGLCQFRLRTRVISARPTLVLDQRANGIRKYLLALHVCAGGANRFLRCRQSKKCVRGLHADIESCDVCTRVGSDDERACHVDGCVSLPEVEGLP